MSRFGPNTMMLPPVEAATSGAARPYPVLAWEYSPYDTREANPEARFAASPGGSLVVEVRVPDDVASAAPQWTEPDDKRRGNPHADAVRIILGGPAGVRDVLFEPFTPGATLEQDGARCSASRAPGGGWTARFDFGNVPAGATGTVQVGVADNDDTYHTQWRWLAPGGAGGSWRLAPAGAAGERPTGTSP